MGVVYRHTVEAFVQGVMLQRGVMSKQELGALGVFPPRDIAVEVWAPAMKKMSMALSPGVPEEQALELSGRAMISSFQQSLVGRGLVLALKLLGLRRTLLRMAENFRSADTVTRVTAIDKGPGWVQLAFENTFGLERHMIGIVSSAMETIFPKTAIGVTGAPDGKGGYVIDVKWDERR
ncbi:MAG: DUF2378 family protein [Myxococcaceae bacterium]